MKALTLRPHWAWLAVNGYKDIENRSWPTRLDAFPIVKRKDIAAHGTYRTQETILRMDEALAEAQCSGQPYQTLLAPPPVDPAVAHPPKH